MDVIDAIFQVNVAFPELFRRPSKVYNPDESEFHNKIINNMNDPRFRNVIIDPDSNEADLNWLAFLWWVYNEDAARINDSLHGFYWSPCGNDAFSKLLDENCRFRQMLANDPIIKAEYAKTKDYIKHINWIFHKTQNLPNVTVVGRGNVPERLHGLRQAKITALDPQEELPVKYMFTDYGQRKRFRVVKSYDITDVLNTTDYKMIDTQNVVIIDDANITLDESKLKSMVLDASVYLTMHGRCLFDLPMYDHNDVGLSSTVLRTVRPFVSNLINPDLISMHDANDIDDYVHDVVNQLNQSEFMSKRGWRFEIEELKLTDAGLSNSIAARVYLKKCPA